MNTQLPTWACIVQAADTPRTVKQLHAAGFTDSQIGHAVDNGYIRNAGRPGAMHVYVHTTKGRKSWALVTTNQVIAHSKAQASVTLGPRPGPVVVYVPDTPPPMRPGAQDFLAIPSKGLG